MIINNKSKILLLIIGYISLIIGFFFNENSSGGALPDYIHHFKVVLSFNENFLSSLYNYDQYNTDHSPLFISTLLIFYKILGSEILLRFFYLHLALLIPFIFFLCLKEIYKEISENLLFLFSCVVFLSPYIRSLSIWPGSEIISLIFLLLGILFFLKFKQQTNLSLNYSILNILMVAIAAYYKPIYSIFSIFFIIEFYRYFKLSFSFITIILLNIILSIPAFYYIFYVNNFLFKFLSENKELYSLNLSNTILIVSSILFFHLLFSHMYMLFSFL